MSILSDLFLDTKDPAYLYNQARCLEQNGRFDDAIFRFEEYLRVGVKLGDFEKAEARKHIVDCQDRLGKQAVQAASTAPPSAPSTGLTVIQQPIQPAPPELPTQPVILRQTNDQPVAESGSGLRTVGIVTAAVGGAALVAGVAFNLKVNSIASDYANRGGYTPSRESDRSTYETLGWVGYGVGAACVATGAVLYLLGRRSDTSASASVAIVPAVAPDHAGAVLQGAF